MTLLSMPHHTISETAGEEDETKWPLVTVGVVLPQLLVRRTLLKLVVIISRQHATKGPCALGLAEVIDLSYSDHFSLGILGAHRTGMRKFAPS